MFYTYNIDFLLSSCFSLSVFLSLKYRSQNNILSHSLMTSWQGLRRFNPRRRLGLPRTWWSCCRRTKIPARSMCRSTASRAKLLMKSWRTPCLLIGKLCTKGFCNIGHLKGTISIP
ncbi:unnamed protein product [Ilex paraguariensis]|uniref:Secreted protein n=1 Tax=Ilex paraguariensis TaxID=185542 RepID=A0ABC8T1I1_9AQUA